MPAAETTDPPPAWAVWRWAGLSLLLLWFSFPPLGWPGLAWVAPVPLIVLMLPADLGRQRVYGKLYLLGLGYWLATFYFIPIPHPALYAGWIAVSAYMAAYTPLTVGACRMLIHRAGLHPLVTVPLVWTGVEWIRCHFATGMGMVCLSHSQYQWPLVIQIADLAGAYTLTAAIALVATCLTLLWQTRWRVSSRAGGRTWLPATTLALTLVLMLGYGQGRLAQLTPDSGQVGGSRIALIQTSQDVIFAPPTVAQTGARIDETTRLTRQAVAERVDLVVWPESGLNPYGHLVSDFNEQITAAAVAEALQAYWQSSLGPTGTASQGTPLLTGGGSEDPARGTRYNAALLIDDQGRVAQRYLKNHLVMFGEYVPLLGQLEALEEWLPLPDLTAGDQFESMEVAGLRIAPSICFETTVPHLIRRQINTLSAAGGEPDVMINLTNDGWFFGTSCLDFHLACNVMRAVEMRLPHLVCANTGISAEIAPSGRLLQTGPRREPAVLIATVSPQRHFSLYRWWGDLLPGLAGLTVVLVWLWSAATRWRGRKPGPPLA